MERKVATFSAKNKNLVVLHVKELIDKDGDDLLELPAPKKRTDTSMAESSNVVINEEMEKLNPSQSGLMPTKSRSIYDLPPEIIEVILNNATHADILNSRKVNRKWYEISSRILPRRYMMIRFCNIRGRFLSSDFEFKSLDDLMDCFKDSVLPYRHFDFSDLAYFQNEDIKRFISIYGKQILGLKITMFEPINGIETLRNLLSEQVPNLKKLDIQFSADNCSSIQLFADANEFQLPKLEVLVADKNFRKFGTLIKQILKAACNLKQLNLNDRVIAKDLQVLQSLNKSHCLKEIDIWMTEDLINDWSKSLNNINLKLKTLNFSFGDIWGDEQLKLPTTSVLNQLLESSKDVIETLGFANMLPGVIFPKLKSLHKLVFWGPSYSDLIRRGTYTCTLYPFQMADVFSNLKELDIHTEYSLPSSQSLIPMPSIEILRIYVQTSPVNREKLMQMTPNVKTLRLNDRYIRGSYCFINGFRVILNNLTKLETFEWEIHHLIHLDLLYKLDAAMTGLTEDVCSKMSEKLRNKDNLSANELASLDSLRKHTSILNLKELKKLDIQLHFSMHAMSTYLQYGHGNYNPDWHEGGYTEASKFYRTGFTKVSQFLAFDQMPNVEIHIDKTST